MGIEGNRAHARHTMSEGEQRFCALGWTRGLRRPAHVRRSAKEHLQTHAHLLAHVARRRHLPGPSLAQSPPALGADAQGPDVRADRRARWRRRPPRCRRRRAASATGTTATAGCATPRSRSGACTLSASTGRPTTSCSTSPTSSATGRLAADHVRDRRRDATCTSSARPPAAATRAPARSGSATPPTASARTTCSAPCSTRCTCTPRSAATSRSGCGR